MGIWGQLLSLALDWGILAKLLTRVEIVPEEYSCKRKQKNFCSKLLVVDVPIETQIQRTSKRDNVSEEQIKSIISSFFSFKSSSLK